MYKSQIRSAYWRLNDIYWWVKYRYIKKHQYHVVRTNLVPGCHDIDERMLHAVMALLCEYVEKEHGGPASLADTAATLRTQPTGNEPADHVARNQQADEQDEAVAIWCWWKIEEPADEARQHFLLRDIHSRHPMRTKSLPNSNYKEFVCDELTGRDAELYAELRALEAKIDADEQAMLHRVINIRRGLWT